MFYLSFNKDSEGTVEFLKKFNTAFDVFNCDKEIKNDVYKTPINASTKQIVFSFLDDFIDYIDGLSLGGKPITKTGRKVAFVGFKNNSIALKMMYEELIESRSMDKINTTDLQQDLLESFFGRMRSRGGNNTNPTQEQFIGNFRRILLNKELTSSTLSNCIDKLQILHVSSGQVSQVKSNSNFIMHINERESDDEQDSEEKIEDEKNKNVSSANDENTETLGIANLAGLIEASLNRNKFFSCSDCASVFELNDKISADVFVKNKKIVLPCKSTYEICNVGSKVMSSYFNSAHISHFNYDKLFEMMKSELRSDHLFIRTSFEHCVDHKRYIIDSIIEKMIKIRCTSIARIVTLQQQQKFVRSAKVHDIHFSGQ